MGCIYVPVSVMADTGIEDLITTIIDKSLVLEQQLAQSELH